MILAAVEADEASREEKEAQTREANRQRKSKSRNAKLLNNSNPVTAVTVTSRDKVEKIKSKPSLIWPDSDPENIESYVQVGKGFRMNEKWVLPEEWGNWAMEEFHLTPERILQDAKGFKEYFTGPDAKKPIRQDWRSTYRGWMRRAHGIQS